MNWQGFLAAIIISSIPSIPYLFLGNIGSVENAAGQAEETFGLNSTFFNEIEREQDEKGGPMLNEVLQQHQEERGAKDDSELANAMAPMVISGDNVYIVWGTNETGNWEVMFRASNDEGETFGDKINLSNSTSLDSHNAEIVASGDKVFISWLESGMTNFTNKYVLRISTDRGQTFGPFLQLSANSAIGDRESNFLTYTDFDFGVQIKYPQDWEIEEQGANDASDGAGDFVGFYSPLENRLDDYQERLWLSVDDLHGENMTIEEYTAEVINHDNETIRNFQLLDSDTDSIILDGYPGYKIVSTQTLDNGRVVKQMEIGTIIGDKVFFLTYYAEEDKYEDYLPVIQDMIDSFEIT